MDKRFYNFNRLKSEIGKHRGVISHETFPWYSLYSPKGVDELKAYLESKSKICIISRANTNQNPVSLSLCLVSLNAHVNDLVHH